MARRPGEIPAHNLGALELGANPGVAFLIAACAVSEVKPHRFRVGGRELTSTEFAYYLLFSQPEAFQFHRLFTMKPRYWLARFAGAITDVVREVRAGRPVG